MISHEEAQELHLLVGAPLELARQNGTYDPETVMVKASDLERARELAAVLVSDTDPDKEPDGEKSAAYYWTGWYSEEDEGVTDAREGVYFITICHPDGEEYASIIHRTFGGQFPLDGDLAKDKEADAQRIVDALNRK